MDVLVSLGTSAAYLYSLLAVLAARLAPAPAPAPGPGGMAMGSDFFETAAMLITFVLFGKYMEAEVRAVRSARSRAAERRPTSAPPAAAAAPSLRRRAGPVQGPSPGLAPRPPPTRAHTHACTRVHARTHARTTTAAASHRPRVARARRSGGCAS